MKLSFTLIAPVLTYSAEGEHLLGHVWLCQLVGRGHLFEKKKKIYASGGTARAPGSHIQILQHCGVVALAGQNSAPTFNIGRR